MYFAGIGIASMQHTKRALTCIVLAVLAAAVAFFIRPAPQVGYGHR
ncbi:MAG TPA: hypothetical protein VHB98_02740 [Chloroflexota bacterium]|nr:hypothetical protein [Chloroflexota bacterium]